MPGFVPLAGLHQGKGECSTMVVCVLPKHKTRVRFSSLARYGFVRSFDLTPSRMTGRFSSLAHIEKRGIFHFCDIIKIQEMAR